MTPQQQEMIHEKFKDIFSIIHRHDIDLNEAHSMFQLAMNTLEVLMYEQQEFDEEEVEA